MNKIRILTVDQARDGAWAIFDYESKELLEYGTFNFKGSDYTYIKAANAITDLISDIIETKDIAAIFIEDIQMRQNVESFKKLAILQGVISSMFERKEYLYNYVAPSSWQSYCNAKARNEKEKKAKILAKDTTGKKESKLLSIEFIKDQFGIETINDNLADAICCGWYCVNNITIKTY